MYLPFYKVCLFSKVMNYTLNQTSQFSSFPRFVDLKAIAVFQRISFENSKGHDFNLTGLIGGGYSTKFIFIFH